MYRVEQVCGVLLFLKCDVINTHPLPTFTPNPQYIKMRQQALKPKQLSLPKLWKKNKIQESDSKIENFSFLFTFFFD